MRIPNCVAVTVRILWQQPPSPGVGMREQERQRLVAEINELLHTGVIPMCEHTMENAVYRYADAQYTQAELDSVFATMPRVLAPSALIPAPGDFFTDDINGAPLIITRDPEGVVRGFHNVCLHRGARVVTDTAGNRRLHNCPFHGWAYDTRGHLRAVPSAEAFPDLHEHRRGLMPVHVVERHGLVWLLPDGWNTERLAENLGALDDEFGAYQIDRLALHRSEILEQPMNWKFVIDGFLETYHFKFLHRNTIGPFVRSNFGLTDTFGLNTRMVVLRASYDEHILKAEQPDDLLAHTAVMYQLFPNTVLVWQGPQIEIWTAHPKTGKPDQCNVRVSVLIPGQDAAPHKTDWQRNWQILMNTVLNEDFAVSRQAQNGLASGALTHILYGRNEPALQAFHRHLAACVEA